MDYLMFLSLDMCGAAIPSFVYLGLLLTLCCDGQLLCLPILSTQSTFHNNSEQAKPILVWM